MIILLSLYDPGSSTFISHIGASLDQIKQTIRSSLTCIYDPTPHKILKILAHTLGLMIFSSLYSFRPFSIPWTKYLRPITLGQIPWTKNFVFPTYTRFSLCESACVHICSFCSVNLRVYATWTR